MKMPTIDPIAVLEEGMSREEKVTINRMAVNMILSERLRELHEHCGCDAPQSGPGSPRSSTAIERQDDIGISALIEYVTALGLHLEIIARGDEENPRSFTLLRV